MLQGHYRSDRNFSFEDLNAAKNRRLNWRNRIAESYQKNLSSSFIKETALSFVNNDLNSAELMAYIDDNTLSLDDWRFIDQLLGLNLLKTSPDLTDELKEQIKARENARRAGDYATADALREKLAENKITVLDTENGSIWQYLA